MKQTALRPKPMPGREPGSGAPPAKGHRPHAARRRGKRLTTLLLGLLCATVLVLTGVGLGTVGATVIGMSSLAEMRRQAGAGTPPGVPGQTPPGARPTGKAAPGERSTGRTAAATTPSGPEPRALRAPGPRLVLGVEAADAPALGGALLVGVHVPGPGHAAGLLRRDVIVAFGSTRVRTAADLVRAVASARPGRNVTLTVRHPTGARRTLTVTPGFTT
ncbi:PDZ domain-containing protein [Streptomyces spectabilis]|uniref:PDZ domain-containing protein n=1 Tax=Streptomyces spectabilis TaxID=68270 RepID=A0A516RFA4_STRST|nr:PDZ domain-containing protein [Streptomyces spectabilis]QDQ14336.1 PDZ domain-containing protein [Streptomyces spectabilis]